MGWVNMKVCNYWTKASMCFFEMSNRTKTRLIMFFLPQSHVIMSYVNTYLIKFTRFNLDGPRRHFFQSLAPGQTTKLRLPSDVTSQVTAWKWTLGCFKRQVELVILGFLYLQYWRDMTDMTWICYMDSIHMCFVIVMRPVCRILQSSLEVQRTSPHSASEGDIFSALAQARIPSDCI